MNNIEELTQKLEGVKARQDTLTKRRQLVRERLAQLEAGQRDLITELRAIGDDRTHGELKALRIECEDLEVHIQDCIKPSVVWQDGKRDELHIVDRVTAKRIYVRRRGGWTTDMYTRHGRPIARMYQPRYIDVKATLGADYDPGPE